MRTIAIVGIVVGLALTPIYAGQAPDSKAASSELRVNVNTASVEELAQLPGIGPKVAARIVAYREKNGSFGKVEEIMNVKGVGEKLFERLEPHVYVDAKGQKKDKK